MCPKQFIIESLPQKYCSIHKWLDDRLFHFLNTILQHATGRNCVIQTDPHTHTHAFHNCINSIIFRCIYGHKLYCCIDQLRQFTGLCMCRPYFTPPSPATQWAPYNFRKCLLNVAANSGTEGQFRISPISQSLPPLMTTMSVNDLASHTSLIINILCVMYACLKLSNNNNNNNHQFCEGHTRII